VTGAPRPALLLAAFVLLPAVFLVGILQGGAASPSLPGWQPLDPPAVAGSLAPNLAAIGGHRGDVALTWLEPLVDPRGQKVYRLRLARLVAGRWSAPVTAASGHDFIANWADFPGLIEAPDRSLLVFWPSKVAGGGDYDSAVNLARSTDGGSTWSRAGLLHDDKTPAEHGFVSWVREGAGVRAFWLDGREHAASGAMTLRTAVVGASGASGAAGKAGAGERLDARVCDCCQTDAALAADGPVVVYRDRSDAEVRDISLIRRTANGWSPPVRVHADEWKIPGCPVNGPAVAADAPSDNRRVAVAWFTGAPPGARVQVAVSADGGAHFGPAVRVDGGRPLGRVDLALTPEGDAVVSWLEDQGEGKAAVRLRRVRNGRAGEPVTVAATGTARASGFPRLLVAGGHLYLAWVEDGDPARLRAGSLPLAAIGAAVK
jgi:hypothetical protein